MNLYYVTHVGQPRPHLSEVTTFLLHGGALSSSMYRTLTAHLTTQSIAVDLPGHGKSLSSGPFTFDRSTELLKSLIDSLKTHPGHEDHMITLVGISLGGQAVLDFVVKYPTLVSTAIVSGVTINPPDSIAGWEMPHMPTDQTWLDLMTEDIGIVGMDAAGAIQRESFAFTVKGRLDMAQNFPPLLICVGDNDIAMAKRDFPELLKTARAMNSKSEGRVIEGAWYNHSVDIPEEFAAIVNKWIETRFAGGQ